MLISFQIHATKITTIYNGIDFADKKLFDLDDLRKEWGLSKDDFIVTMVARFDLVKCHTVAFEALKEVVQVHPNVKLLLVGDGTPIRRRCPARSC